MRSKLLTGVAALGLTASMALATAVPASAAPWGYRGGWHGGGWHGGGWHGGGWGWPAAVAAGVVGGAVAAATSPLWAPGYYDYDQSYAYGPGPYAAGPYAAAAPVGPGGGGVAYCESRFRSYNPETGTYTGYDGMQHPCP